MRIPSFTELATIFPRAPSMITSPEIDFAVTVAEPPLMTMSPRVVSAETSLWEPSTVMKL